MAPAARHVGGLQAGQPAAALRSTSELAEVDFFFCMDHGSNALLFFAVRHPPAFAFLGKAHHVDGDAAGLVMTSLPTCAIKATNISVR